jgi:hypothetical protein
MHSARSFEPWPKHSSPNLHPTSLPDPVMSVPYVALRRTGLYCHQELHRYLKTSPHISCFPYARWFSNNDDDTNKGTPVPLGAEWRKTQLDKLEKKFADPTVVVDRDEDLQPMWKQMESRVIYRKPRTVEEMGGRTGRINIKKTDEEMWLREGLYDDKGIGS